MDDFTEPREETHILKLHRDRLSGKETITVYYRKKYIKNMNVEIKEIRELTLIKPIYNSYIKLN